MKLDVIIASLGLSSSFLIFICILFNSITDLRFIALLGWGTILIYECVALVNMGIEDGKS